jgi:hypothetical protein
MNVRWDGKKIKRLLGIKSVHEGAPPALSRILRRGKVPFNSAPSAAS